MESCSDHESREHLPETITAIPASELLQNASLAAEAWPSESTEYPQFLAQIGRHQEHIRAINGVLDAMPFPTLRLETAAEQGYVSDTQVKDLYASLADILEDKDYMRLALYLPFELLPAASWTPGSEDVRLAAQRFKESYLSAWQSLLGEHDARANFVDGDVLETELRPADLPRVVKAAHFIPKLVELGMIDIHDVINLAEVTEDPVLKNTIADALRVLRNEPAIPSEEQQRAAQSAVITERRQTWLEQKHHEEVIRRMAESIKTAALNPEASKILTPESGDLATEAFIEGISQAIEHAAITGQIDPQPLYDAYKDSLLALQSTGAEADKRLVKSFRHFYRLGLTDEQQLTSLGIPLPHLAGPLSDNLELLQNEINYLERITATIESDPVLAGFVYPVVAVGGSRLKGYGEADSDLDTCIFIKPGTSEKQKEELRALVRVVFSGQGLPEQPIEFWLDEAGSILKVKDFLDTDPHIADSYWTHLLFETAWVGNDKSIDELHQKLLAPYFYDTNEQMYGHTARNFHLQRLEQDLLQYRLMHKGYKRHYPRIAGVQPNRANLIDGNSVFWDPGYRQLATQLFVNNVFLPKLTKK